MKREFTNTELATYQQCPKMWDFKYRELLSPKREKIYFSFGRAMHIAFNVYYSDERSIDNAITQFITEIKTAVKIAPEEDMEQIEINRLLGLSMLNNYFEFASKKDDFEIIEKEQEHTVSIIAPSGKKSTAFEYNFRPDQIVSRNNQIWIHEFKTAGIVDNNYISNLMLDEQMSRYCWAYEKYSGKIIEGVIYTIIKKKIPAIPELLKNGKLTTRKNIDTTHDVYMKAIKDNNLNPKDYFEILDMLRLKGNTFMYREIVLRNKQELKECEQRLWVLCKTINTDPPIYKCPNKDCTWRCDYRNLCIEDTPEARSTFLKRDEYHPEKQKK